MVGNIRHVNIELFDDCGNPIDKGILDALISGLSGSQFTENEFSDLEYIWFKDQPIKDAVLNKVKRISFNSLYNPFDSMDAFVELKEYIDVKMPYHIHYSAIVEERIGCIEEITLQHLSIIHPRGTLDDWRAVFLEKGIVEVKTDNRLKILIGLHSKIDRISINFGNITADFATFYKNDDGYQGCLEPLYFINVAHNGDVSLCSQRRHVIGNLKKSSLKEIYSNNQTREELIRKIPRGRCEHCEHFRVVKPEQFKELTVNV